MQKVTENYLSKVTRYFYFVTSQHCKLGSCGTTGIQSRRTPQRVQRHDDGRKQRLDLQNMGPDAPVTQPTAQ